MVTSDSDVKTYASSFFGFGNEDAPYVFIGLEEGGSASTLGARLARWRELGSTSLVDIYEMHQELPDGLRWFTPPRPPIQSTWGKLIRILLAAEGLPSDREAVRTYQRDRFGRIDGETALVELMPLPSQSLASWQYSQSGISELATRDSYVDGFRKQRLHDIRKFIEQQQRCGIVFYGRRREWPQWLDLTATPEEHFDRAAQRHLSRRVLRPPHEPWPAELRLRGDWRLVANEPGRSLTHG